MSKKLQNKYKIPPERLQRWNDDWNAAYLETICTIDRAHYFGEIVNDEIQLSETREVVYDEWLKTFDIRVDINLIMGEFIVMPNHCNGIIIIGKIECKSSFLNFIDKVFSKFSRKIYDSV